MKIRDRRTGKLVVIRFIALYDNSNSKVYDDIRKSVCVASSEQRVGYFFFFKGIMTALFRVRAGL